MSKLVEALAEDVRAYVKRTEASVSPSDVYLTTLREVRVALGRRAVHIVFAVLLEAGASHDHVVRALEGSYGGESNVTTNL